MATMTDIVTTATMAIGTAILGTTDTITTVIRVPTAITAFVIKITAGNFPGCGRQKPSLQCAPPARRFGRGALLFLKNRKCGKVRLYRSGRIGAVSRAEERS